VIRRLPVVGGVVELEPVVLAIRDVHASPLP
jgi:hypothetical protein